MKNILIHSVSVVISFFWLVTEKETYNPISLKGPDFLKFYLILLLCFYTSVFVLNFLKERVTKVTILFIILIFLLGMMKLIKGMILDKPVGYLLLILFFEGVFYIYFMLFYFNKKLKLSSK